MAATKTDEIILGSGELYLYEFTGTEIPAHEQIETEAHNVGHCSGGFSIEYVPEKYNVVNQYGKTVRSFVVKEELNAKTGILSWDLEKLSYLSAARFTENAVDNTRKLTFGNGNNLKTVLLRFVHTKPSGKKLRFTMVGQGGNGFNIEFTTTELTVDAQISAIEYIKNFLAEFEEEMEEAQG